MSDSNKINVLRLSTPDNFESFPYTAPYPVQVELMKHLYTAIEDRKVTIVESPTGTGKTLSLLCSSLTWLADDKLRSRKGKLSSLSESADGEPDWVVEQSLKRMQEQLDNEEAELEERLSAARRREQALRKKQKARAIKKAKYSQNKENEIEAAEDESYLPDDDSDSDSNGKIRALINSLLNPREKANEEKEKSCTKIFYASRTHSQLSQVLSELHKLKPSSISNPQAGQYDSSISVADAEWNAPKPRVVTLASRNHLCINDKLKARSLNIDESCRDLLHAGSGDRCPYLPAMDEEARILDMRDSILATPKDIEDLYDYGKDARTCPYFGARSAVPMAELVALPYNLLLHRGAREALEIDLTDQIVVIDEAHNLIETLLGLHAVELSMSTLLESLRQIRAYFEKFRKRLSAVHSLHLKRLVAFLNALVKYIEAKKIECMGKVKLGEASRKFEEAMTASALIDELGSRVDGINLLELLKYLKNSKIARKISGYSRDKAQSTSEEKANKPTTVPLHTVEAFLAALTNGSEDGRVSISIGHGVSTDVVLRYQHLNPLTYFDEIVSSARCVILAGGTMSPMTDVVTQLFPHLPPNRFSTFSCGHVIPSSSLRALVLGRGPQGGELQFTFKHRDDTKMLEELGQAVANIVNIAPAGTVVFFPSYAFLDTVKALWSKIGIIDRIQKRKKVFFEPREGSSVEEVLRDYSLAACGSSQPGHPSKGALLLAVVGAKLSEGLNFRDDLARAVLVVGLPFPNINSPELKERMKYIDKLSRHSQEGLDNSTALKDGPGMQKSDKAQDAPREFYENLCMRAVNQSIGRAIRHADDWATIILLDSRYSSTRIRSKLPGWIQGSTTVANSFGEVVKSLALFYQSKRR